MPRAPLFLIFSLFWLPTLHAENPVHELTLCVHVLDHGHPAVGSIHLSSELQMEIGEQTLVERLKGMPSFETVSLALPKDINPSFFESARALSLDAAGEACVVYGREDLEDLFELPFNRAIALELSTPDLSLGTYAAKNGFTSTGKAKVGASVVQSDFAGHVRVTTTFEKVNASEAYTYAPSITTIRLIEDDDF